jgi:hypothetical protein
MELLTRPRRPTVVIIACALCYAVCVVWVAALVLTVVGYTLSTGAEAGATALDWLREAPGPVLLHTLPPFALAPLTWLTSRGSYWARVATWGVCGLCLALAGRL